MARNRAIQAVLELERAGELAQRRVLGYPVWPLERARRYRIELLDGQLIENTGPGVPLSTRLRALAAPLRNSLSDLLQGLPERGRDVWVLSTSLYRRSDADGVPQCIFAEDLRAQLGERLLFIERTPNDLIVAPRPDVLHVDAAHVTAMVSSGLLGKALSAGIPRADCEAFEMDAADLCRLALYGHAMEALARAMIARARPRAVFVLCAYHPWVAFQRAVRAAGIPLIELQHGLLHDSHPGYVLGETAGGEHVPDHFVAFGRRFAHMLEQLSEHWQGRVSVGGHAWLRRKCGGAPAPASRRVIAVFSQVDPPVREALRGLLAELAPKLPEGYSIVVKPHPREPDAAAFWGGLAGPQVQLAARDEDSYELLRRCRLCIGVYSTVVLEAIAFGCTSVVTLPAMWTDDIAEMVAQGVLLSVQSADDVLRALTAHSRNVEQLADDLFAVAGEPLDFRALLRRVAA